MKDFLSLWAATLANRPHRSLTTPISVTGSIKQITPRRMFAMVSLAAIPNDQFEVVDATMHLPKVGHLEFPEAFVLGLLDILMTDELGPLVGMRVTLTDIKYHDTDSSAEAFACAGQDAGRQVCRISRPNPDPPTVSALRIGATLA